MYSKLEEKAMASQDERQNVVTEMVNNIKVLRLNSWVNKFEEYIETKREAEIRDKIKLQYLGIALVTSVYFFPSLLDATVFSVYIGTGNKLDISVAFTVMTLLNLLADPLNWFPMFMGLVVQFLVSIKRI
jgi:ABC-type bacteriocin/lantibiotic exporter with double-glycine peptidase domain